MLAAPAGAPEAGAAAGAEEASAGAAAEEARAATCDLLAWPSPLAVLCAAVSDSACRTALPAATALASPTRSATR